MKYTKAPLGLQKYWVKIKKSGSKYWKVVPLETALSTVANEPIEVQCAGRTDAGVHATGQVVHFNCDAPRNERAWTLGVNANLPDSVAVTWAKSVPDDFHARFSATHRRYRYVIQDRIGLNEVGSDPLPVKWIGTMVTI